MGDRWSVGDRWLLRDYWLVGDHWSLLLLVSKSWLSQTAILFYSTMAVVTLTFSCHCKEQLNCMFIFLLHTALISCSISCSQSAIVKTMDLKCLKCRAWETLPYSTKSFKGQNVWFIANPSFLREFSVEQYNFYWWQPRNFSCTRWWNHKSFVPWRFCNTWYKLHVDTRRYCYKYTKEEEGNGV